jgi:Bardet-Biedl syndrome 4 protein
VELVTEVDMYLAITLNRLEDYENACSAYEKSLELESDHIFELNYSITLYNRGDMAKAKQHFKVFEQLFNELDEETKNSDSDVLVQRTIYITTD